MVEYTAFLGSTWRLNIRMEAALMVHRTGNSPYPCWQAAYSYDLYGLWLPDLPRRRHRRRRYIQSLSLSAATARHPGAPRPLRQRQRQQRNAPHCHSLLVQQAQLGCQGVRHVSTSDTLQFDIWGADQAQPCFRKRRAVAGHNTARGVCSQHLLMARLRTCR